MARLTVFFMASLLMWAAGCSSTPRESCTAGAADCRCATGNICRSGLVCQSGTCVNPNGTDAGNGGSEDTGPGHDVGHLTPSDAGISDVGSAYCGPDGGMSSMMASCTSGAVVPGCPCPSSGMTGTCQNGRMTTCSASEFPTWGACTGSCFSSGLWHIDNTSPCLLSGSGSMVWAFSSWTASGMETCGGPYSGAPTLPTHDWSDNQLQVDCQGTFTLCYTIKAGDSMNPMASDCTVAQVCTTAYYADANAMQTLPPLGPWLSSDSACASSFLHNGGYGEMSVVGVTEDCQNIGAMDHPYVFNRFPYCPSCCGDAAGCGSSFDCTTCSMGGSGGF